MNTREPMGLPPARLPRHCSFDQPQESTLDTILFRGEATTIGQFSCPASHPAFRDSGPIRESVVVFPRTSVWIQHRGARAFVADPNVVTIYNRGQAYERSAISPEGDRCDWFAVSDVVAREIAERCDPAALDETGQPFRFERGPSTPALYVQQRSIVARAARGDTDPLELEEAVLGIVACVLHLARGRPVAGARRAAAQRRQRDLAEAARAELMASLGVNRSVSDLARSLGTSPFHLCRVFRAHTGGTMHAYRMQMRVRVALERLSRTTPPRATISQVAHELGFASHAHLVRSCREQTGMSPTELRVAVRA